MNEPSWITKHLTPALSMNPRGLKAPNSKHQTPEKHQAPNTIRRASSVYGCAKRAAADCQSAIQQTKLSALRLRGCKGSGVQCAKFSSGNSLPILLRRHRKTRRASQARCTRPKEGRNGCIWIHAPNNHRSLGQIAQVARSLASKAAWPWDFTLCRFGNRRYSRFGNLRYGAGNKMHRQINAGKSAQIYPVPASRPLQGCG